MRVAVEGCAHGELERIYDAIQCLENKENMKVDLLLCCGDFQTTRNEIDLRAMAVPPKYYNMCSFYKYYSGEKLAPILTILIGGNHEASNYLQELPYGGWVAPNIYYLGYAGVVNIAGVRIAGLSGIYKERDFLKGHFEMFPYDDSTKRSVYHIRNMEVFRFKQLSLPIDIFLSHDWPTNVTDYGNTSQLIRFKPHFKDDIAARALGSKPCEELLTSLKPKYWFSAHLHCKFSALIPHEDNTCTKFLALDKCLPHRRFLQTLDIPHKEGEQIKIKYDLEWLTTLVITNHLLSVRHVPNYMPGPYGNERYRFTPTDEEKTLVLNKFKGDLTVPENFIKTAESYVANSPHRRLNQPGPIQNPQTIHLCNLLGIDDPVEMILTKNGKSFTESSSLKLHSSSVNVTGSDINCDEHSGDQTFIDDTVSDGNSPEKLPVPRLTLNLPEPKIYSTDCFFIDTCPSNNTSASLKRSSIDEESTIDKNPTNMTEIATSENKNLSVTNPKKIMRRNINIYTERNDV